MYILVMQLIFNNVVQQTMLVLQVTAVQLAKLVKQPFTAEHCLETGLIVCCNNL